jgi:hypothetical protein
VKYDDAAYHVGNAKSDAHAAAHIGLYFRWALMAGLVSDEHTQDPGMKDRLAKVKAGSQTGTKYLWDNTSGKLADVDFTPEGNQFTRWFYSKRYLFELRAVTGKPDYQFTERELDFAILQERLDAALQAWRTTPPPRAWWKLW